MDLFEFLGKIDESSASYHFEVENEGNALELKLDIDSGFYTRYSVKLRINPRGVWEVHGLPDGDAGALIEAYELAERHGTRSRAGDEYTFDLDQLVDLIADVR